MTLDEVAIVTQVISTVGVVGSLIFVGLQVRQFNQIQSVSKAMFELPDLSGI
jgi:hypothetical protein